MPNTATCRPDKIAELIQQLNETGAEILHEPADCWPYGSDNSRLHQLPAAVALVENHQQTVQTVQICNNYDIPITARGRGTGTTGAAVPSEGGLVVSFERMKKVLQFDRASRTLRAETGITNREIQDFCKPHGFFWAPDPGSADFCTLGGNLACNAAGPRAIKYGTCRENTLALKAVTGSGQEITTGTQTSKGVVGLDLTRLLIGSEGTLALITEAVIQLTPLPSYRKTMQVFYPTIESAASAVAEILSQAFTPCALELMDQACLQLIRDNPDVQIPPPARAMLLIEVDGNEQTVDIAASEIRRRAESENSLSTHIAANDEEADQLHAARKMLSPALRKLASGKINEDIVVPVSKLADLIKQIESISSRHGLTIVCFGHAGNGNIHTNILFDSDDAAQTETAHRCLDEVFRIVLELGGTLSGEHGTGLTKKDYLDWEIPAPTLRLMRSVAEVFDPNNILNRDKKATA